ncbi:MAG: hypothetical protein IT290_05515 [Deltaproteobacteria bacterium]|nr:hypothetical protein [Deltaproteobacteria bacterium]
MIKLSDALDEILNGNPFLKLGLHHSLFNLSQLSRYLLPQVSARTKRDVQPSAVLMSLSRIQRRSSSAKGNKEPKFEIDKLTINSHLCIATYGSSREVNRAINELHRHIQQEDGFFSLSEGTAQLTLIVEKRHVPLLKKAIKEKVLWEETEAASIGIRFDKRYLDTPGFIYFILQQLYFQNINVLELTSTTTELIIYLKEQDVRLAFDTLYYRFR